MISIWKLKTFKIFVYKLVTLREKIFVGIVEYKVCNRERINKKYRYKNERNEKIINRYKIIIVVICNYYGIKEESLGLLLKNKEKKYLFLLLMRNFNCLSLNSLSDDFLLKGNLNLHLKKAEEKVLINKSFRDDYFELEDEINKKIKKAKKTLA